MDNPTLGSTLQRISDGNSSIDTNPGSPPDTKHIVVVGGGVTGLSTAYHLRRRLGSDNGVRITLLEQTDRLGGKIVTEEEDGFLLEGGPDCFLTRKTAALDVCREIGLDDDLLSTNKEQRKVRVLSHGRLHPLPEGVMLIVPTRFLPFALSPLFSIWGKVRMAFDFFIPRREEEGDETLGSFVRRRLGQEALDKLAEPLLSGIHVSDADRLSLKSTFPRLMEVEKKHGSLIRGMLEARRRMNEAKRQGRTSPPMFMSLRGGMQQIVDGMAEEMTTQAIDVHLKTTVTSISSADSGGPPFTLRLEDGESLEADAVVVTTPSNVTSELVQPLDGELSEMLRTIGYVSTAVISLGYRRGPDVPEFKGFGFIIPKSEERRITACTFTSTKFNNRVPEDHQLLRVFMGGPGREEVLELNDDALVEVAKEELGDIMGLTAEPAIARVFRWHKLNPQYDLNHLDRVEAMRERAATHGPVYLAGCAYDGVGVPDCIRQGKEAAEDVVNQIVERSVEQGEDRR